MVERIAVTGATGLVGRALVGALVARGDDVVVLARDTVLGSNIGPAWRAGAPTPHAGFGDG